MKDVVSYGVGFRAGTSRGNMKETPEVVDEELLRWAGAAVTITAHPPTREQRYHREAT